MDAKPLISVVIPVYNCEQYIEATLNSIVSQQGCSFEIILIDDCSTDNSEAKVQPYLGKNVQYFRLEENCGGPSVPRNIGASKASGEFIALFDSDDVMLPGKLARYAELLSQDPDIDFISSDFQTIDEQGNSLKLSFLAEYQSFRSVMTAYPGYSTVYQLAAKDAYTQLLNANFIGNSSVVIRKSVFESVGGFDKSIKNSEDFDLWLRVTAQGHNLIFIDEVLHQYRIQSQSISFRSGSANSLNRVHVLEKHLTKQLNSEQESYLKARLYDNYFAAGFAMRQADNFSQAINFFSSAWKYKKSVQVIKQWLLCLCKVSAKD